MGEEFGLRHSAATDTPDVRVVLGFPDVYEVGMSHLGFRLLFGELARREELVTERVFLPWPDMQQLLAEEQIPLASLESQSPLASFDMIGMSVQYELAYPAVLKILDLAGIPRRTSDRMRAAEPPGDGGEAPQQLPLVLVGGSAALNPEPLAPFVDCFFLGEADQAIHEIVDCLAEVRHQPLQQQLARLARVPGIYVPELVQVEHDPGGLGVKTRALPPAQLPVQRRYVEDLDRLEVPPGYLVPTCGVVHDRVTVEIQRGCCQGCRFCQAGFTTRPVRQRSADPVLRTARRLLSQTGYQDLALLSLSAGDHPQLQQILARLIVEHGPRRVALSLPSLRTESLLPAVAEHISKVRKSSFTLAPEAATDRLRRVINKQNSDDDLLRSIATVVRAGYSRIKLYFMIGLPTETDEDVLAISALARKVKQQAWDAARPGKARNRQSISVSVSTFVPKPHTPFQWEAAPQPEQIRRKVDLLRRSMPQRVRLQWHDAGQSLVEAYLARGDRRLAGVLEQVTTADHTGMDAWTEHFDLQRWQDALEQAHGLGQIPAPRLYLEARDPALPLPWDHLDMGVERSYLEQQRQAALDQQLRPDCSDGTCDDCGVCPEQPMHRLATELEDPDPGEPASSAPPGPRSLPAIFYHRLWFKKRGRACLISHLEMVDLFERACRRAELPLAFSRGFHPKPRFRFSPALPLGAQSDCEYMELGLTQAHDPAGLCQLLQKQLPPGLLVSRCESATGKLAGSIQGIRWELELERPLEPGLVQRARQRLAAGPLIVERAGGKQRDLSQLVQRLERLSTRRVAVVCRFGNSGTVKPEELGSGLLELDARTLASTTFIRREWVLAEARARGPTGHADGAVQKRRK